MGKACRKMRKFAMGGEVDNNAVLSGLLQQLQTQNQPSMTQSQIINSDMNNLGKIDPVAGEGSGAQHNWMVQSASDIARQTGVNPNAAYRPGSASDPHAAGIAQPQQQMISTPEIQRNAPTQNRMTPISEMFGKRRYADGGKVEDVEALLARMKGKYGVSSKSTPEPAPQPAPQPVQQPATNPGIGHGIVNILKGRKEQIDKASGYSNGGKIKGPGTPTSDSIDASVKQTGEPIKVSTDERILSKAQDVELSKIASDLGFPSLDSWLETMTGKPVGPTMKGGIAHAATGATEEEITRAIALQKFNAAHGNTSDITNKRQQVPFGVSTAQSPQQPVAATGGKNWWEKGETVKLSEEGSKANKFTGENRPDNTWPAPAIDQGADLIRRAAAGEFKGQGGMPIQNVLSGSTESAKPLGIAAEATSNNQGSARSIAMGADADAAMNDKQRPMPVAPGGIARIDTKGQSPLFTNIDPGTAAQQLAGMKSGAVQMGGGEKDPGWINDAYGNDMRPTLAMKAQLAEMQRERNARDMQSDIKDPRVIATAALNAQRMNREDALSIARQHAEQQGISAGLDQQVKRNSLAEYASLQKAIADMEKMPDGPQRDAAMEGIAARQSRSLPDKSQLVHLAGGTDPNDPLGARKLPDRLFSKDRRGMISEVSASKQNETGATIPSAAADMLKKNPSMAEDFDKKYGVGAAKQILGK